MYFRLVLEDIHNLFLYLNCIEWDPITKVEPSTVQYIFMVVASLSVSIS